MEDTDKTGALDDLMPEDPLMAAAWAGSLQYAIGCEEDLKLFREETGNNWTPAKSGIDRMIDEATGAELGFMRAFAKWHNENIWGRKTGSRLDRFMTFNNRGGGGLYDGF